MSWMVGILLGLSALAGLATLLLSLDGLRQRVLTWNEQRRRHHALTQLTLRMTTTVMNCLPCGWKT